MGGHDVVTWVDTTWLHGWTRRGYMGGHDVVTWADTTWLHGWTRRGYMGGHDVVTLTELLNCLHLTNIIICTLLHYINYIKSNKIT